MRSLVPRRPFADAAVARCDAHHEQLVGQIRSLHEDLARHATKAVNVGLTLRNWLIGCHIQECELRSEDRSEYGERLCDVLAGRLVTLKLPN